MPDLPLCENAKECMAVFVGKGNEMGNNSLPRKRNYAEESNNGCHPDYLPYSILIHAYIIQENNCKVKFQKIFNKFVSL